MQKKIGLLVLVCLVSLCLSAQTGIGSSELSRELYTKAKSYIAKRDYPNAILVYNQLNKIEPRNLIYRRELAYTYYLGRDYNRAMMVIEPLLRAKEADVETFLTASQIYKSKGSQGQALEALEKGIKKFPESGLLYADYGKLYSIQKRYKKAEEAWEKGVKNDPEFHLNYYNLAKSYFVSKRPIWAIVYGEIFVNKERYSGRTEEIKRIIYDSYKQLIANNQMLAFTSEKHRKKLLKTQSDFEQKMNKIYTDLQSVVFGGVDVNNVVMLRTRFLLRWMQAENTEYPFAFFEYLSNIIRDGHFENYNQWLFGRAANEKDYIKRVKEAPEEFAEFEKYFSNLKFNIEPNQYYK